MRRIGRIGIALAIGCWSLGLWAAVRGASPVLPAAPGTVWWPGAGYAVLVVAVLYAGLEGFPTLADALHRAAGADGVPVWTALGSAGLALIISLRWGADLSALAALELFAWGMAGLYLASLTAPLPAPGQRGGLPPLAPDSGPLAGEGEEREIVWTGPPTGYSPAQPNVLKVSVDRAGLLGQEQSSHSLPPHRLGEYAAITPAIRSLARQVRAVSQRERLDRLDEVHLVLGLVSDGLGAPPAEGGPLYPLECLSAPERAGGAARTMLAAAVLGALGYRPALLQAGDRVALAVAGACHLPDLFLQVGGKPTLYAEVTPAGVLCGDAPAEVRALPWVLAEIPVS